MNERLLANLSVAFEAVVANKVRSFLTALGIIFGVAAVIAMLAIGNGAQQEILNQIKLVGVNNIVIEPIIEQTEEEISVQTGSAKADKRKFTPGLTLEDARSIARILPGIEAISPEIVLETYVIRNGIRRSAKLVGVDPAYFNLSSFELNEGAIFNPEQIKMGTRVCVIGKSVKAKFFADADPVGKMIKVGPHWLKVIGVLKERLYSQKSLDNLGLRDFNMDIYTPVQTVLVNYRNRAALTETQIQKANQSNGDEENKSSQTNDNYHQLDKLTVQVENSENLAETAEVISRMLKRRHYEVVDFEVTVPELLLKQQQRTNDIFNLVLGAIAGISLLVGGIGIMNIMLASVMERIKEIGLRISLGAKKSDVVNQFLFEAVMISISGGIIGVILGVVFAVLVSAFAEIPTIISGISIVISFGVAATVGLIFGIAPARKAANQDPITSLRHE